MTFAQIRNYIKGLFNPIVDKLKQDIEDANGVVPINIDDFNRLPQSEKDNGKAYFIPDVNFNNNRPTPAGFTPVGTVISVMGNHAPSHYLICDGAIYNISQYPELANYFKQEFGSKNYFGGDGVTTFAVPDLRGEFLRGTGTNSHSGNGNGSTVGVHQDATQHLHNERYNDIFIFTDGGPIQAVNTDTYIAYSKYYSLRASTSNSSGTSGAYTSRPTNTSVLYCIAVCNIYIDVKHIYSTQETLIGEWIDGKPLYQKTINCGIMSSATKDVVHNISNLGQVVDLRGIYTISANEILPIPYASHAGIAWQFRLSATSTLLVLTMGTDLSLNGTVYVTIQYTKTTD